MKKTLLALAVLGSFVGAASAQSSVTLSGSVDLGFKKANGVKGIDSPGSGRNAFTLSGVEDLGNGTSAIFLLNHRFSTDTGAINVAGNTTGTSPQYFWRNAWVGLRNSAAGEVRLGRILMPLQDMNGGYESFNGGDTVGNVHTGGGKATVRATNAVYYKSPSLGGLTVHLATAEAEGQVGAECGKCGTTVVSSVVNGDAAFNGTERPVGAALSYSAGPLSAGLAYDKNARDWKTVGLYAKYNFGVALVNVQYEKGDVSATAEQKRASISAGIPVGAATVKVGYRKQGADGTNKSDNKLGLGVDYALSKRTTVYADMGKSSGDSLSAAAEKTQYDLGIWHKF
ncbi:MAG: hypothetical protein RIQ53_4397 [Pseudomonadota bacterium]|jgi:predicted porin